MLFFSYAREGEICPDGCPGPRDCCPTFGREKPKTITEYARELRHTIPMGLWKSPDEARNRGLKGTELKNNLLEILEFIRTFQEDIAEKVLKSSRTGLFPLLLPAHVTEF